MFRDSLIFDNSFRLHMLEELADQLDWELVNLYPARASSHAGRIWVSPEDIRIHYIEDARFYVRYLILQDDAPQPVIQKLFSALRQVLPTLEPGDLFDQLESSEDVATRIEALHKTSALVSPADSDPAYCEMLRRLLSETQPLSLRLATLQLCEYLALPALESALRPLAQTSWPGQSLARSALAQIQGA